MTCVVAEWWGGPLDGGWRALDGLPSWYDFAIPANPRLFTQAEIEADPMAAVERLVMRYKLARVDGRPVQLGPILYRYDFAGYHRR